MNVSDKDEVDRILALADIIVPDSSPELLGVVRTSTNDAKYAEGMAPREGSGGGVRIGGDLCQDQSTLHSSKSGLGLPSLVQ